MVNKKSFRKVFRKYFRHLWRWTFMISLLFVGAFGALLKLIGFNRWDLLILAIWAFMILLHVEFYVYYFRVQNELLSEQYKQKLITIKDIKFDKRHNFELHGRIIGYPKMILVDTDRNEYRIYHKNKSYLWDASKALGMELEITYLPKSKFVLSMNADGDGINSKERAYRRWNDVSSLFKVYTD